MCLYLAAAMSTVHIGHMLDLYSMQESHDWLQCCGESWGTAASSTGIAVQMEASGHPQRAQSSCRVEGGLAGRHLQGEQAQQQPCRMA